MAKLKLNDKLQSLLCKNFENGKTIASSCASVGISESTFYNWYSKGEKAKTGRFKNFQEAVDLARGTAISNFETVIINAVANGDTDLAKWWLERRCNDYRRSTKVEANVEHNATADFSKLFRDLRNE